MNRILVTGATGKVGQAFLRQFFADPRFTTWTARALCHNRLLEPRERLEVVRGSIAHQDDVTLAMDGVTHVLHLATVKETPDEIMDVAVKGMFQLLEACRQTAGFQQFLLVGGDAAMGHFFYPHPLPVTETQKHSAYPGCYALSKVLEEVMLEQYYHQYDLNGACLRAPWIMEKDDFRYTLSFGDDVFGGPRWRDMVGETRADEYVKTGAIPVMCDADGKPILRNFVHVEDLASALCAALDHPDARQQTFNICMDEPVDYGFVGQYLHETRSLPFLPISTSFHSTWLDNSKAKFRLGWKPRYDTVKLVDAAWDYKRDATDPRVVWYPG